MKQTCGELLSDFPSKGLSQTEAFDGGNYLPDISNTQFSGKTFVIKSAASGISPHANIVASVLYGNNSSMLPGAGAVDCYGVSSWLNTAFLRNGSNSEPNVEARSIQNHSWISDGNTATQIKQINQRLDYAIDRDGFICVVGVNNGSSTTLPGLLCQTYHTISVGLTNGIHTAGFTTNDGNGRIKPDIVAPSTATSFATPLVSGASGILQAKLVAPPYSLTGADIPRVTKAILLASARRDRFPNWSNSTSRPLDTVYGAGELNIFHAFQTLSSGRTIASNTQEVICPGWSAESIPANSSKTYYFTVESNSGSTSFGAALTWHRVITDGLVGSLWGNLTVSMVDLNLRLVRAENMVTGEVLAESRSSVDNVELIYQKDLLPGSYAMIVSNDSTKATPYALAFHTLPRVTLLTSNSILRESDGLPSQIIVRRTGSTSLPLLVPITHDDSAISSADHTPVPGEVIIPTGAAEVSFDLAPIPDSIPQGDRTLVLGIGPDFSFTRSSDPTLVITLKDKPFDKWRHRHFDESERVDAAVSSASSDPDGDGLTNLVEYALDLDPKNPSSSPLTLSRINGRISVRALKNIEATDVTVSAEVSPDLLTWSPLLEDDTDSRSSGVFQASEMVSEEGKGSRFIRLRVTRP